MTGPPVIDWIVLQGLGSARELPLAESVQIAAVVRRALMSHCDDPIPACLNGHSSGGSAAREEHVGFLTLPTETEDDPGSASSRIAGIAGIAVSIPHTVAEDERQALLGAIGRWEHYGHGACLATFGSRLLRFRRLPPFETPMERTLRASEWEGPSRRWATATPAAIPHIGRLDESPDERRRAWAKAADDLAARCEMIGLPRPEVQPSFDPPLRTGSSSRDYPAFRPSERDPPARLLHALMEFSEPVAGPIAVGLGRYCGLGLMRPMLGPK